ncbi:hypothetical protein A2376_02905 [Candidatus Woesebacteria bacterium RIFOXYB1_FULL_47_31]|uniref:Uncharacterized protein n=2 Tax=Candidatus Woeseibacteriota TaxID=1752722 RepID=A0A1F8D6H1_9BACT|nr:MAG: hypothetical protein A2376_02905 [Candidatus Woesebacteria bacterium RIFOXYB1_FULL_47_31]OGM89900.1 MAG: hypothetical protein A2597_00190 [Candidatus Woesebacteria bacterium RIFOXYD1_FULL_46_19]
MPLPETVTQIREQQRKVEERASIEEVRAGEVATKAQEQARTANLEAFNKFEQEMHLRESLDTLVEAEFLGIKGAEIRTLVAEPVAVKVELILKWRGEPKHHHQEGVIRTQSFGSFSLSITRDADGIITVAGKEKVALFHESSLVEESGKREFEEAVAQAYLKPRWTKHHDLIIQPTVEPAHGVQAWPPELRD